MLYNTYSQKLSGRTRSRKDPVYYLNMMVVGQSGSGKTSFIRTFYETMKCLVIEDSFKESKSSVMKDLLQPTEELYTISMLTEEDGQRTALTIIDTPGFNSDYSVDHQVAYINKYIDYQFHRTLAEETKVKRDAKAFDSHIHCCLYFIDTSSLDKITENDRYVLRSLSSRVNIIPVIGKADTLTASQRIQLKTMFRREIFDVSNIPIYGNIELGDEDDEDDEDCHGNKGISRRQKIIDMLQDYADEDADSRSMIQYLENMPFTLIGYEEDPTTGNPLTLDEVDIKPLQAYSMINLHEKSSSNKDNFSFNLSYINSRLSKSAILGRKYPWANVECANPTHCDFSLLRHSLLKYHRDMLRVDTFEHFYEKYRTEQLLKRRMNNVNTVKSKKSLSIK
ncbi:Septin-domain-containing protein [Pilobolus umbonatus]|nr:Septin-domain-containing protein [Pilobolus umbonatus]